MTRSEPGVIGSQLVGIAMGDELAERNLQRLLDREKGPNT
jgi:hypothetical protein